MTAFDLENSKSVTLPFEMGSNIAAVALSPDKKVLITVDEDGRALLVNYRKGVVLNHFNFKSRVASIVFSPCGRYFAASHGKQVHATDVPTGAVGIYVRHGKKAVEAGVYPWATYFRSVEHMVMNASSIPVLAPHRSPYSLFSSLQRDFPHKKHQACR